jgi:hypothetical protein
MSQRNLSFENNNEQLMKKVVNVIFLCCVSLLAYCQAYTTPKGGIYINYWDSLSLERVKDIGFYEKREAQRERRIDTFFSKTQQLRFTNGENERFLTQDYFIYYDAYENLLTIENESDLAENEVHFLVFLCEVGSYYDCSKYFQNQKGQLISIDYRIKENGDKKIQYLKVHRPGNTESVTFFK